jgi:hypothetical protein
VFGPGDLAGQPYEFSDEKRALIYRAGTRCTRRATSSRVDVGSSVSDGQSGRGWRRPSCRRWIATSSSTPRRRCGATGSTRTASRSAGRWRSRTSRCWPTTRTRSRNSRTASCRTCASEGPDADLFDISLERIIRLSTERHRRRQGRAPGAVTERARRCPYHVPGVRRAAPHVPAAAARGAPDDEQQPAEAAGRGRVVVLRRHRRRSSGRVDRGVALLRGREDAGRPEAGTRGSSSSTATPAPCTRARSTTRAQPADEEGSARRDQGGDRPGR